MSLQEKAMLMNLTVKSWSARKRDKDVGSEVEKKHQATDAGNFNKLLIDKAALKPLTTLAGRLRETHYTMTLPWGDNGDRLLPSKMYLDYMKAMRDLKDEYAMEASRFCSAYDKYRQDARKRLGTMYDPMDYPDSSTIRKKFSAHISPSPVPEAKDFRVDLGEDEVKTIREDIEAQVAKQQAAAIQDLWKRLYDVVERIHDRLIEPEAVFRDSLIENAVFACSIASKLNINEDPMLEALRHDIEDRLTKIAPQRLRDDAVLRAQVATHAATILLRFPVWPTSD